MLHFKVDIKDANILIVDEVPMDLSFFDGELSHSDGSPCGVMGVIGTEVPTYIQISLGRGDDHMHVFFDFDFPVGVTHNIGFINPPPPGTWPPEDLLVFTVVESEWVVRAPSKKDQKVACTGEGKSLSFEITIVP